MDTSPLPSWGPTRGRKCYATPAFSGVPNTKCGEKIRSGYLTLAFSRGSNAKRGEKIRSGCLTLAFSGAQKRAEVVRNPCILGGPQRQARGQNQKWLPHPLPSWGPKRGRKCYVTPAFSGGPQRQARGENQKWLPHPCLLGGPEEGGSATYPLHSRGVPNAKRKEKIRSGYLTRAFSGAQKRAEVLRIPYIFGGPIRQAHGQNQKWPTGGHIAYRHAFSVELVIFSLR